MEFDDVSYSVENEQQFWDELDEIVSTKSDSEDLIDHALRAYLNLTTKYKDDYLRSDYDISRCSYKLFSSNLFAAHADYVRRQIIYSLLQEDDPDTLQLIVSFLLFDGRQNESTFNVMNEEGSFPRLLELIQLQRRKGEDDPEKAGAGLCRLLMDLLYEMSRIQTVKIEDLVLVDDEFIKCLFEIIEEFSCDPNDPYHYPVIRVLLVLNEQFMIAALNSHDKHASSVPLTNKVIKILSMHGNLYKTFGENIILLINREAETSLQLLTLKLLYRIFTTANTYEYFYTNDLHVLVDILIRNLLDLPEEAIHLRHTYLRVLYPLLAHTQLKYPPHYKRDEVRRMLNLLVPGQFFAGEDYHEKILHFEDVDDTTKRLVGRCASVKWLQDEEEESGITAKGSREVDSALSHHPDTGDVVPVQSQSPDTDADADVDVNAGDRPEKTRTISMSTAPSSHDAWSPTQSDGQQQQQRWSQSHANYKPSPVQSLGMQLEPASSSSLSVQEVAAAQHEAKPGEPPSSASSSSHSTPSPSKVGRKPKIKPEPPRTRRWRGRRIIAAEEDHIPESGPSPTGTPPPPSSSSSSMAATTAAAAAAATTGTNRRNSTSTSLAPPIPGHLRRSASNPPPAVPPPRRSTLPFLMHSHLSADTTNHNNYNDSSNNDDNANTDNCHSSCPAPGIGIPNLLHHHHHQHHNKHGPKPEPPKARRGGRAIAKHMKQQQTLESVDDK